MPLLTRGKYAYIAYSRRSVLADSTIADKTDSFHAPDVVYTGVSTSGSGPATLVARSTFEGNQVVADNEQSISPNGPARTVFNLSKPTGLASGRYTVEILLNGKSVEKKRFVVQWRAAT